MADNMVSPKLIDNKRYFGRILYLIALSLFLALSIFDTTTFPKLPLVNILVKMTCYLLITIKLVITDDYSMKEFLIASSLCVIALVAAYQSNYTDLLLIFMFVVGARNIDFREINLVYLIVGCMIIVAAIIASKLGLIENYTYYRGLSKRESFGVIYPTDFAAHIFYLILSYCYFINRRLKIFEIILFGFAAFLLDRYCDARLDVILIVLTIFFFYVFMTDWYIKLLQNFIRNVSSWLPAILFCLSLFLSNFYKSTGLIGLFNKLLSDRLALGNRALMLYPIKLFGQSIEMHGFGGKNGNNLAYAVDRSLYFYIDSSYLAMLLQYGVVLTVFLLILITLKNKKVRSISYSLAIILVLGSAFVDQTLLKPAYNVFLLSIFSFVNSDYKAKDISQLNQLLLN